MLENQQNRVVAFALSSPAVFAQTSFLNEWGRIYLQQIWIDVAQFSITAGLFFLIFYVAVPRILLRRKIQEEFPASAEVRREVLLSLQSVAIFAAFGVLIVFFYHQGWTHIYLGVGFYGWGYLFGSILLFLFIQDAWFYWAHRFLHWRPIYRMIHHVHHHSHNPTPWAAFSFHPFEAVINALIFPLVILLVPINLWVEWIWFAYMFFISIYLHLGYETMPRSFARHWFGRWSTTALHHNMHHTHVTCNYGLYFTIWDRIFSTKHPDLEKRFEEVTAGDKNLETVRINLKGQRTGMKQARNAKASSRRRRNSSSALR